MHSNGVDVMVLEESQTLQEWVPPSFRIISEATLYCESSRVAGSDPLQNMFEAFKVPEQRRAVPAAAEANPGLEA